MVSVVRFGNLDSDLETQANLERYHQELAAAELSSGSTEGSCYPVLARLIEAVARAAGRPGIKAMMLPRAAAGLCPDLQVHVPGQRVVGYVEAKLPGADLNAVAESPQLKRYREAFPNLLLTDYQRFLLFRRGSLARTVGSPSAVAGPGDGLVPLLAEFLAYEAVVNRSAVDLAGALAHRSRHLRDMIQLLVEAELKEEEAPDADRRAGCTRHLAGFYHAFKRYLIADLEPSTFADLYAQTLAFGLFVARTRRSGDGFDLESAANAVPETIGILRDAFRYLSIADPPKEVRWILEDLVEVLRHAEVDRMFRSWFHKGLGSDPVVHFYETYLKEYDEDTRKLRGVFYTPLPLVSYVVRSVHELLKKCLYFESGLAHPSVRVLDPAAGTLAFVTEAWDVARKESSGSFGGGGLPALLRDHLLQNFHALELMVAPYAVGHLRVGYLLREWGAPLGPAERCQLFLANALDGRALQQSTLPGMASLSREAHEAERVRMDPKVNVVVGNPPYSGHSANETEWIQQLLRNGYECENGDRDAGYFQVAGEPLEEKNPKWLQDDYVKFLRFAQWKIDQAGEGVVGLVTNHGYLDNPTFRGMRASLLRSFDRLYLLNLHGHARKGETAPDGRLDENVFSIRQGVAVALLVKKPGLERKVLRADLWGSRREKLDWLASHDWTNTTWTELHPRPPFYLFSPLDPEADARYGGFVPLPEIFPVHSVGVVTGRDALALACERHTLEAVIGRFRSPGFKAVDRNGEDLRATRSWDPDLARRQVQADGDWRSRIHQILFRPFDHRWIFYSDAVVERPRRTVMEHMLRRPNLGLVVPRQGRGGGGAFVTTHLVGHKAVSAYDINTLFPLYLTPGPSGRGTLFGSAEDGADPLEQANVGRELHALLASAYGARPGPEEVLGYVYAVLYAPSYRKAYAALLELDFPRVPWPRDPELFRAMARLGTRLAELHLLRAPDLVPPDIRLEGPNGPVDPRGSAPGPFLDEKPDRVLLSRRPVDYRSAQCRVVVTAAGHYFSGLRPEVWGMEIGGHQVLRRWLLDRAGHELSREEIESFCKIATALGRTLTLQEELDRLYPLVEGGLLRRASPVPRSSSA